VLGRVGFSPWGALAYNMATNRKFHSFVGKSAKGLYNVGKKMVNRRAQKLRFNNRARANRVGIPGAGQAPLFSLVLLLMVVRNRIVVVGIALGVVKVSVRVAERVVVVVIVKVWYHEIFKEYDLYSTSDKVNSC